MQRFLKKIERNITHRITSRINPHYKLNYGNQGFINFIDVGSIGSLPKPWLSHANTIRRLLKFDPNDSSIPSQDPNIFSYPYALWETEKEMPLYIYGGMGTTGASLFKQNTDYVKNHYEELRKRGSKYFADTWFDRSQQIGERKIVCIKLDTFLESEHPSIPFHFMKIDAQGAEYNILKGSQKLISSSCIGLHLELFSLPLLKGIALLEDVEAFLADHGFKLIKKFPAHGSFDSQQDCLFLKDKGDPRILSTVRKMYRISQ